MVFPQQKTKDKHQKIRILPGLVERPGALVRVAKILARLRMIAGLFHQSFQFLIRHLCNSFEFGNHEKLDGKPGVY